MIKIKVSNVNPAKLQDELMEHGVKVIRTESMKIEHEYLAKEVVINLEDDVDVELVQRLIDNHDPTPLPPIPTEIDYLIELDFQLSLIQLELI